MSEIDAILSQSGDQLTPLNASPTQNQMSPVTDAVQSASSIQELEEMLKILDNAASTHHPKITQAVQAINNKIKEGANLNEIKTSVIR